MDTSTQVRESKEDKKTKKESVQTDIKVRKRNGDLEKVDTNKVCRAVSRECTNLADVDAMKVAIKTIAGIYDGVSTKELDLLSINTAASLTVEEPQYSKLAARLLSSFIDKEVRNQEIYAFSQSISIGYKIGLINERVYKYVTTNARKLNDLINIEKNKEFEYFGLKTVYDRYLLKHPTDRVVIETPQYFFMRIACALTNNISETKNLYNILSSLEYLPGSPTLLNSGTIHEQMSSCYLVNSPEDDLGSIYDKYKDVAFLSKYAGGVGLSYSNIRSRGSLIKGTNGKTNGIVSWLKTLDSSVNSVSQAGLRRGACCVYLEPWHADIEEFLELRDNTGDESMRTHNLNLANWIPDLFMKRVEANELWSLFDPNKVKGLPDVWGDDFNNKYLKAEADGLAVQQVPARDLYAKMMKTIAQTGNGWMTFKDAANSKGNQTKNSKNIIHSSNLCVAPETLILTDKGHIEISALENQTVNIWNGYEWSSVTVKKTATNVQLVRVKLNNGVEIDCTPEHKFPVAIGYTGKWDFKDAWDLTPGTKLAKFNMPIIEAGLAGDTRVAYVHGFFCGDGTYENSGNPRINLYGEKKNLLEYLNLEDHYTGEDTNQPSLRIPYNKTQLPPKFCVPLDMNIEYKINWLMGVLDSDGTVGRNGSNEAWLISSINLEFLNNIRLMLSTMGVESRIGPLYDEGDRLLPDGHGSMAYYHCQESYRLIISSGDSKRLYDLGVRPYRVKITGRTPQRDAKHFVQVLEVEQTGRISDTFCFTEPKYHLGTFNGIVTGQCTEIMEVNSDTETAVCNIGSINLSKYMRDVSETNGSIDTWLDFDKLAKNIKAIVCQLDNVIDYNFYPIDSAKRSNLRWRPIGLGLMGLQDVFFKLGLPFDSAPAMDLSLKISQEIYYHALSASADLAESKGRCPAYEDTRTSDGVFQFDLWPKNRVFSEGVSQERWDSLKERIKNTGLRNSLLIAIAPTATIASIAGCYECIEPQISNLFKRETLSGEFIQVNKYLIETLKKLGMWNENTRNKLKMAEGSVQGLLELPTDIKEVYRTVWEIPQRSLIDMAAARGAFIDQGQSLNLFIENPNIGQLSSMYMYAWKKGLKSTYYLRSRPATKIAKTTVEVAPETAVACSLDNREACEVCQ